MKIFVRIFKTIFPIFLILIYCNGFSQDKEQLNKFGRVIKLLEDHYVDSVNVENLVEKAIIEMLKELDPHTVYLNKDDVKRLNEPLKGNFEGIGVQFNILKDTIYVIAVIEGGPSEKAGILPGDRIITVDSVNVAGIGINTSGVRDKLLGNKGTEVHVGILRSGEDKLLDFKLIRDKIPIYSVDASYMIDDETGYIKLSRFSANTMSEYDTAFNNLRSKGMKNLILDLSGNGGGYLNVAVELADEFLSKDELIVFTEGVNNPKSDHLATEKGGLEKGRLVLLINEGSASASEILSGAVQDWDRGILIGRRSYGKGLVQRQYPLIDGTATRITIARYYTPTGRSIQRPYDNGVEEYKNDLSNRKKHGELFTADSIHEIDSLKFTTLKYKRTVYGGGGIMPDIFIPLDTTSYTDFYRDLVRKGIINAYALGLIDTHRDSLNNLYPDFPTFDRLFIVDTIMINDLMSTAVKEGIDLNDSELELSRKKIETQLKALIARDLFYSKDYYQILNRDNPEYLKAVEVISSKKTYNIILKNKNQ